MAVAEPIVLKYGREEVSVAVPAGTLAGVCRPRLAAGNAAPEQAILSSLRDPISSLPLARIARGGGSVAILISGRDRVTGSEIFVKVIADELNAAGIPDRDI